MNHGALVAILTKARRVLVASSCLAIGASSVMSNFLSSRAFSGLAVIFLTLATGAAAIAEEQVDEFDPKILHLGVGTTGSWNVSEIQIIAKLQVDGTATNTSAEEGIANIGTQASSRSSTSCIDSRPASSW